MGDLQRDKERAGCVAKRLKDHLIVVLKQGRSQNFKLGGVVYWWLYAAVSTSDFAST